MINKNNPSHARQRGFTIVELLIVIVVIGILAAITIVAYNAVQERARIANMQATFSSAQKGIEMYMAEHGSYPSCTSTSSNNGCNFSEIESQLSVSGFPDTWQEGAPRLYAADIAGNRWAVRFDTSSGERCKMGQNYYPNWWDSAPACW